MSEAIMRYSGYTWHHNPKSVKIRSGKTIVELCLPFSQNQIQNLGEKLCIVEGSGELFGNDCTRQYENLRQIYLTKKTGVLSLPGIESFNACFEQLCATAQTTESLLEYSFVFRSLPTQKKQSDKITHHTVSASQTLWDIARIYGVSIEKLVENNPQIRFIDELVEGQRVKVC